jgi:RNA polymerase sigma factor (sigma-70 family)
MVNGCTNVVWRHVARVFHDGTLTGMSDREVLERFVDSRDESAFEVLLTRHGPMVLNVCRQLLRETHDVEDAFKAAFLVLVRKASSIRVEDSLGPWLYAVARRTAARARANRRRRGEREFSGGDLPQLAKEHNLDSLEVPRVVQEELSRMPERLRVLLILCCLQGLTHELAARELGCPVGTVRSRLARARALLQKRIVRRGLSLSAAALATTLESNANAAVVPPHLRILLIKVATQCVSGSASQAGGVGVTASVAALLEGVLHVMKIKKMAILATALISLGVVVSVVGVTAHSAGSQSGDKTIASSEAKTEKSSEKPAVQAEPKVFPKTYYVGDIIGANLPQNRRKELSPGVETGPMIHMDPLIRLIATTIAPGTWRIQDSAGSEVMLDLGHEGGAPKHDVKSGQTRPMRTGAIVPFFLSLSLIIRCTPEVQEQVANLLRGLRDVVDAREGRTENEKQEPTERPKNPQPQPPTSAQTSKEVMPPASPKAVPGGSESRQRIQKLIDELTKELANLPPFET